MYCNRANQSVHGEDVERGIHAASALAIPEGLDAIALKRPDGRAPTLRLRRTAFIRLFPWLLSVLSIASGSNLLFAADKSAVGPSAISVPKGPGSIEGLGESFQPSLNTGTASYGIGLQVPPGTAGHGPGVRLSYEGGGGNGPLGIGWNLPYS
jgi:hypothetical protein